MTCLYRNVTRFILSTIALVVVASCGGGSTPSSTTAYSIGGTVSGLDVGQAIALKNNGGDDLTVSANGAFTFATQVTSGGAYAVTVSPPAGKACTVTGGSGMVSANVTSVAVICVSNPTVSIGVSVSGLVGQGLTLELITPGNHGVTPDVKQELGVSGNGHFVFPTPVASGHDNLGYSYRLHVKQQPASPVQSCATSAPYVVPVGATVPDVKVVCGGFAYVTDAADNTVSAFSIDATTGTLAAVGQPVPAGMSPSAIAGTRAKKYLYVSNRDSNDVSAYAIDALDGSLTTVPGSPFAAGTHPQAVSIFDTTFVSIFVANSGSDDVSAYSGNDLADGSTGVLTPWSPASYATGAGPSAMIISPGNLFLYTANASGDISAFHLDLTMAGRLHLTPIPGSPFSTGVSSVTSMAFGAGGKFLYAADASGATAAIIAFSVDPGVGALAGLPGSPLPFGNHIVADQTGTYLYATTGTDVVGYSIDAQTGALSALPGFPVATGVNATSVSIHPTNRFLYVAHGSAGTVTGFELNPATGALTPMPGSPFAVGASADFIATF